jgi:hypothetical protein
MKKVDRLKKDLEAIEKELQALSFFRNTLQLQKFIRQLQGERSYIKRQIEQGISTIRQQQQAHARRLRQAQSNRSEKNRRNWRYWNAISVNYGIPIKDVRRESKKRRKGLDSDIQDTIWRNPSP